MQTFNPILKSLKLSAVCAAALSLMAVHPVMAATPIKPLDTAVMIDGLGLSYQDATGIDLANPATNTRQNDAIFSCDPVSSTSNTFTNCQATPIVNNVINPLEQAGTKSIYLLVNFPSIDFGPYPTNPNGATSTTSSCSVQYISSHAQKDQEPYKFNPAIFNYIAPFKVYDSYLAGSKYERYSRCIPGTTITKTFANLAPQNKNIKVIPYITAPWNFNDASTAQLTEAAKQIATTIINDPNASGVAFDDEPDLKTAAANQAFFGTLAQQFKLAAQSGKPTKIIMIYDGKWGDKPNAQGKLTPTELHDIAAQYPKLFIRLDSGYDQLSLDAKTVDGTPASANQKNLAEAEAQHQYQSINSADYTRELQGVAENATGSTTSSIPTMLVLPGAGSTRIWNNLYIENYVPGYLENGGSNTPALFDPYIPYTTTPTQKKALDAYPNTPANVDGLIPALSISCTNVSSNGVCKGYSNPYSVPNNALSRQSGYIYNALEGLATATVGTTATGEPVLSNNTNIIGFGIYNIKPKNFYTYTCAQSSQDTKTCYNEDPVSAQEQDGGLEGYIDWLSQNQN